MRIVCHCTQPNRPLATPIASCIMCRVAEHRLPQPEQLVVAQLQLEEEQQQLEEQQQQLEEQLAQQPQQVAAEQLPRLELLPLQRHPMHSIWPFIRLC